MVKNMLMKICNRCGKRLQQNEICECQKVRHKIYNLESRDQIKNAFYQSKEWQKASAMTKARANGLDEYALVYENRIVKGNISHHIMTIEEKPELKLSLENLIYVSLQTHNKIHAAYDRGGEEKAKMIKRLQTLRGMQN